MFAVKHSPSKVEEPLAISTLDFVNGLARIDNVDDVAVAFQAFVEHLGFANAACVTLPEAGELVADSILMNTRPADWTREYLERDYLRADPMIGELFRSYHPFAWGDVTARGPVKGRARGVMELADDFGMDCGFVVPIFDTSGNTALVSIAGKGVHMHEPLRGALTLASTYVQNQLCTLKRKRREDGVRLTARELECLKWIAAGKSDWQTGRILSISAKTVNYHVENVKRKFGVATRIQSVVAAIRQGKFYC